MKRTILSLTLILCGFAGFGQNYPKSYFDSPLEGALLLNGTFGELRDNHFHAGVDFSTGEQEGLSVRAAADGYVSRIKVSASGLGKVIYVTHPNGYVTVYAHLSRFRDDIQQKTLENQKAQKSYEIEVLPKKNELLVKKGEEIALSGNSGNSAGPHLHFEIRDERSEEPINPLLFGLPVIDTQKPILRGLRVYPQPGAGIVEQTDSARSYEIFMYDSFYTVGVSEYIKVWDMIGVGFDVYDQQEGTSAELGIYSAELFLDGNKIYEWRNDRLDFDDMRYANAHGDYEVKKRDGATVQRCFRMPGNLFTAIYPDTSYTGWAMFNDEESHDMHFIAYDFTGNKCEVTFQLQPYSPLANKNYQAYPKEAMLIGPSKGVAVHKEDLDVVVPTNAVYEEMYYWDDKIRQEDGWSDSYMIGNRYEALHVPITIGIKPSREIPDSLKSKALLSRVELDGKHYAQPSSFNKGMVTAKVKEFGTYIIELDTLPPSVIHEYYPADLNTSRGAIVQVKVDDELSGLKTYSVSIDGEWRLASFDAREKLLTVDLQGMTLNMQHKLAVTVTDERGNTRLWMDEFWW